MKKSDVRRMYERVGQMPETWELAAGSLLSASRLLQASQKTFDTTQLKTGETVPDEGRVHGVEIMLRGFALECLFKSLWVAHGNPLVENGRYRGVPGAGQHDLAQIAAVLPWSLSTEERDLLRRLTDYVVWAGRYPIPKRDRGGKVIYWTHPTDDTLLDAMIARAEEELEVLRKERA